MAAPLVTTVAVSQITATSAVLLGSVNTQTLSGTADFKWGLTSSYGNTTPSQALPAASVPQNFTATLTGLTPGVEIFFAAVGSTTGGTVTATGLSFTPAAATAATAAASSTAVSIPVIQYPITIIGSETQVVEQGSFGDVVSCILMVANSMAGSCPELPTFGIPDPTGQPAAPNPSALIQAIEFWEPRANQTAIVAALDEIGSGWAMTLNSQAVGTGQ